MTVSASTVYSGQVSMATMFFNALCPSTEIRMNIVHSDKENVYSKLFLRNK